MPLQVMEAYKSVQDLTNEISRVIAKFGDDCDAIQLKEGDLEERLIKDQLLFVANCFSKIQYRMEYLNKPIRSEGMLRHNSARRYSFPSGDYFTSGSTIEILTDKWGEFEWVITTIEHNGNDYYATALGRDYSINGLMARMR